MKITKIKKVLIAIDYSSTAQKVAESGFSLAKSMDAEVILLHTVVDVVIYSMSYVNMGPLLLDSAVELKDAAQQFLDKTKHHLGDAGIKTVIVKGKAAESIIKTADDLNVDIIVMGTHSQKWLENIVMGSVTEKVLRQTVIPLFIIPTKKID
jgi:nucleotide-binding universal stress UspA family protein